MSNKPVIKPDYEKDLKHYKETIQEGRKFELKAYKRG